MCILMAEFLFISELFFGLDRLLKLTGETNITSFLTTDLLLWPLFGFGHGIKSLGALMFKDTCTVGKMLRSNQWTPLSPASWDARVTNGLCKKRTFVYKSASFHKKKKKQKKTGENLICISWLSSDFWLRQHDPFVLSGFSIMLVLDYLLTHTQSINRSVKRFTNSSGINQAHSLIHPLNHSLTLSIE